MIAAIAILLVVGVLIDWAFRRVAVPGLVGLLIVGVIGGPFLLGWISPSLIALSEELRLGALIIILLRAGLEVSRKSLRQVGGRVLLLAIVPAIIEGLAITLLGPLLLGLTWLESAVLGAVLAAVSPAVIVHLMLGFIDRQKGTGKGIPQMVLAASAIDDVFVIVIYGVLVVLLTGRELSLVWQLGGIPVSIALGMVVGVVVGFGLFVLFRRFGARTTRQVLVVLSVSALLFQIKEFVPWLPFPALLAVMAIGMVLREQDKTMAGAMSLQLAKLWMFAEILLFVLVGAQVDLRVAIESGLAGVLLIVLGLVARSVGTWLCLLRSAFNRQERWFVVIAAWPKATVQAAIGGGALVALGLAGRPTGPGEVILAVAVLSILLTAPVGAWAISLSGERWLSEDGPGIKSPVPADSH
ncbi:MAG TPA: sodium:proton antiporter [Gammaproteobacteria bacterium]|nr:sodium:proton antiporter [Gammaproteobacteria bacterium]